MPVYIFDLGGVLIRLNVSRCMQAFEALMGEEKMRAVLGMDSRGEGVKAVSVATKQLMADFERGLITAENFIREVQRYCRPGTTEQEILDAWMSMLDELPAKRLQFVDNLHIKGYKVYLLSNGNDLHFEFINRTYNLEKHFDGLFLSQQMHMAKPEPQIFETVHQSICEAIQQPLKPSDIIFIDDIQTNRQAAEKSVHWRTYESIDELQQLTNRQ